jgi:hypothetical protein
MSQRTEFVAAWLCVLFGCVVRHVTFDLSCHKGEGVFDVEAVLGRGLQVTDIIELGLLFAFFFGDLSFLFKITFVSDQNS